jgi:acetyl esterase/lipase
VIAADRTKDLRVVPLAMAPRGARTWPLTAMASLLAVLMAGLAYCMVNPVRWDGPGMLGAVALFFPLHLLAFTLAAGVLALFALRRDARLAAGIFGLVVILTATMAVAPSLAVWRRARQLDVPLSLGNYLANAGRLNVGLPQRERTVVYGTGRDGTKLELDVWRTSHPTSGPLRPAIVVVRGGAWTPGDHGLLLDWNRWLNQLGYEVFDVEYRMAPPVRWLDEIGDVKAALAWVVAHAAEYHVDPARISLMGGSGGGNLSMLAAYSAGDPRLPPSIDAPPVTVRSVINFYGPSDMALLYRTCASPDYVRPLMREYIGGSPEEFPDRYRVLSPLTHVGAHAPPTLTIIGKNDRLVSLPHARRLNEALTKAGVPHELIVLPANDHVFDVNWGGFGTQIAREKIKTFLQKHG